MFHITEHNKNRETVGVNLNLAFAVLCNLSFYFFLEPLNTKAVQIAIKNSYAFFLMLLYSEVNQSVLYTYEIF